MEFLDTPNPNAKKILMEHNFDIAIYLNENHIIKDTQLSKLLDRSEISSIFTGPGFITVTKHADESWDPIMQDFATNLDNI
tara:strand:+ start:1334 stop:1576 length:243 start_codon:yes stop_codon:yes gene_type:complete